MSSQHSRLQSLRRLYIQLYGQSLSRSSLFQLAFIQPSSYCVVLISNVIKLTTLTMTTLETFLFQSKESLCECMTDYLGDGSDCTHVQGRCLQANGGCDVNAVCSPVDVTGCCVVTMFMRAIITCTIAIYNLITLLNSAVGHRKS